MPFPQGKIGEKKKGFPWWFRVRGEESSFVLFTHSFLYSSFYIRSIHLENIMA